MRSVVRVSMGRLLTDIADAVEGIGETLRSRGFVSGYSDREWMHRHSPAADQADLQRYDAAYAREVVFSGGVSGILISNPGEYEWVTPLFIARARTRFESFGDVHELFRDPRRRHLIELTNARQLLSRVLEGLTPEDHALRNERNQLFDALRAQELDPETGLLTDARKWWKDRPVTLDAIHDYFAEPSAQHQRIHASHSGFFMGRATYLMSLALRDSIQIGLRVKARIESTSQNANGALFPDVHVRLGPPFSAGDPPTEEDRLFFHDAFPNGFREYSRFDNKEHFVLNVAVWRTVFAALLRSLAGRGWL